MILRRAWDFVRRLLIWRSDDEKIFNNGGIRNDDYDLTRTTTIFHTDSTYLSLQAEGNLNENFSVAAGVHNMHNTADGSILPSGAPYSPGGKGFFESGAEKIIPSSRRALTTNLIVIGHWAAFTRRALPKLPNKLNRILATVPTRKKITASN